MEPIVSVCAVGKAWQWLDPSLEGALLEALELAHADTTLEVSTVLFRVFGVFGILVFWLRDGFWDSKWIFPSTFLFLCAGRISKVLWELRVC